MKKFLLVFMLVAVLVLVATSVVAAEGDGEKVISNGCEFTIEVLPPDALFTNDIYVNEVLIADSKSIGTYGPFGPYPDGSELEFSIYVRDTSHTFYSGPAERNPDGIVHARVLPVDDDTIYVGFEDIYGGGDYDFTDARFYIHYQCPVEIEIDIKPGSYPNSINPNANGVIPVAILTTADFDASSVDPETVQLDGVGARGKGKSGKYGSLEDVDDDGDLDLVVQVLNAVAWADNATEATLTGRTWDGIPIIGTDSVNLVPPEQ